MQRRNTEGAFTLIELLVVVSIISLLASIVITSLGAARQKGADASKIRALSEIRNALNLYFNDTAGGNGAYPSGNLATGVLDLTAALVPKYIPSIDAAIKYQSLNAANNAVCASNCPSYHLAITLSRTDNTVLIVDKDVNDTVAINGRVDNCISGTMSIPDLCYDITP